MVFGSLTETLITSHVMETDKALRNLPPNKRKCYFEDEMKLKYFKVYTQNNWMAECISDRTFKGTGCVPFYFIRNKFMKVCNILGRSRAEKVKNDIISGNLCEECLPSCNQISYETELNLFHVTRILFTGVHKRYPCRVSSTSEINIRFKEEEEIYPTKRYQAVTLKDFLSNVGGLMCLFAGISVLLIVVIFYFFVVRLLINIFKI